MQLELTSHLLLGSGSIRAAGGDGRISDQTALVIAFSGTHRLMECRLSFQNQLLQLGLHCMFSSRTGTGRSLAAMNVWNSKKKKKTLQNIDTDLFLIDSAHRKESLWHPVSSPHNLIINWQYTLIAESLSQGPKQEAHKRDEVGAVQVQRPTTIKTLLIKITLGTNQQLKLIVFIVPRIKNSHGGLMSWKHLGKQRNCFHNR